MQQLQFPVEMMMLQPTTIPGYASLVPCCIRSCARDSPVCGLCVLLCACIKFWTRHSELGKGDQSISFQRHLVIYLFHFPLFSPDIPADHVVLSLPTALALVCMQSKFWMKADRSTDLFSPFRILCGSRSSFHSGEKSNLSELAMKLDRPRLGRLND